MKKYYFLLIAILLFLGTTVSAQNDANPKQSGLYRHNQMKYVYAMKYNDWRMAANALYDLIVIDPADDSLKLNLGYLYYENNVFASALFVSSDLISRNSENERALELNAVCYERMGLKEKAISSYESLYLLNNDLSVLFTITALQFESGRLEEAMTNAQIIAGKPQAKDLNLTYPKGENGTQDVSMEVAVFNLMGMIEKERGNKEQAKAHFNKALSQVPDFELAKNELAGIE